MACSAIHRLKGLQCKAVWGKVCCMHFPPQLWIHTLGSKPALNPSQKSWTGKPFAPTSCYPPIKRHSWVCWDLSEAPEMRSVAVISPCLAATRVVAGGWGGKFYLKTRSVRPDLSWFTVSEIKAGCDKAFPNGSRAHVLVSKISCAFPPTLKLQMAFVQQKESGKHLQSGKLICSPLLPLERNSLCYNKELVFASVNQIASETPTRPCWRAKKFHDPSLMSVPPGLSYANRCCITIHRHCVRDTVVSQTDLCNKKMTGGNVEYNPVLQEPILTFKSLYMAIALFSLL